MSLAFDNLPVGLRKDESGDTYSVGVTVNGAFLVFGQFKAGGVEDDLQEAADAAAQAQAAQTPPSATTQ